MISSGVMLFGCALSRSPSWANTGRANSSTKARRARSFIATSVAEEGWYVLDTAAPLPPYPLRSGGRKNKGAAVLPISLDDEGSKKVAEKKAFSTQHSAKSIKIRRHPEAANAAEGSGEQRHQPQLAEC